MVYSLFTKGLLHSLNLVLMQLVVIGHNNNNNNNKYLSKKLKNYSVRIQTLDCHLNLKVFEPNSCRTTWV